MCDGGGASGAFCGKCNDGNKLCRALTPDDTCTDLVQNNLETDLDCGGEECQNANAAYLCAMVKGCSADADCASAQAAARSAPPAATACWTAARLRRTAAVRTARAA